MPERDPTPATHAVVERYWRLMGTQVGVHVAVAPAAEQAAEHAITACLNWLRDVERVLTRFDASSELSRLNDAGGRWCKVSQLLFDAVEQSVAAARATEGLFDPTLLPILEALGYDRDFALVRTARSRPAAPSTGDAVLARAVAGDWRGIELDAANRRLRLPRGTRLDLGGIAKGWAADLALDRFFADYPDVLLDIGGDIRVRGGPGGGLAGGAWPIGIGATAERSNAPLDTLPVVSLGRGGLATSGAGDRWWYAAGQRQHHLIDPRTGRPAQVWIGAADERGDGAEQPHQIAAVAALAPTAAHAEIAAKVAILRGYPAAVHGVEQAWSAWNGRLAREDAAVATGPYGDAPVALVVLLGNGEVASSSNLRTYLETLGGGGNAWLN